MINRMENNIEGYSHSEILDMYLPRKEPVVKGLLNEGLYMLAGAPKTGKSFLVMQLGYCVSKGHTIWGYQCEKHKVLYLALEDEYKRLQERLFKMFGTNACENFIMAINTPTLKNGLLEELSIYIQEKQGIKLIIIDTFQKVRDNFGDNYNYADDYKVVTALKEFADKNNICILLVHHTRKQQSEDKFDMISGTNGLLGGLDGGYILSKDKRIDQYATFEISGRDIQDQKLYLGRNEETLQWELNKKENVIKDLPKDPLLDKIEQLIEQLGEWTGTPSQLVAELKSEFANNVLSRYINCNKNRLYDEYGIDYSVKRTHNNRVIILKKVKDVKEEKEV